MGYLDINGLLYFYTKIKGKFALSSHTHSAATTTADGFLSSTDKTKLNGISSGATKNTISQLTITLTTSKWSNKTQSATVSGVTTSNGVIVDVNDIANGIKCTAQASNTLTFTCESVPTSNVTVNVMILV